QRRYVESLSAYARQFLEQMDKPDVDSIEGLSPAIAIEQKTTSRNPRSTVGTVTEIYDYLRLLFARIGRPHCPQCGDPITAQTVQQMVDALMAQPAGAKLSVLAPIVRDRKGEYRKELQDSRRAGFIRARIDGKLHDLAEEIALDKQKKHTTELVVDHVVLKHDDPTMQRLADSPASALKLTEREQFIAHRILKEIRERLGFLINVGLDYLTLDRAAATLSGGEGQRIRLATQIGSGLVGVLYILDEPSIGLHQRDNQRLLDTLMRLRDLGNTVIVVEHDAETMRRADYILDLGPGPGVHGGSVVARGSPAEVMANEDSLTGQYLRGDMHITLPHRARQAGRYLTVAGAREHNLKNVTVRVPLGLLTCVTGVSGYGKSTLLFDVLYRSLRELLYGEKERGVPKRPWIAGCSDIKGIEHIDKIVNIDQSPIGRTPRSNPATY